MTDRTVPLIPTWAISRALWSISTLMQAGRVTVDDTYLSGAIPAQVVTVDVSGYPQERDEILTAIPDAPSEDWAGEHGQYRVWRGLLLTMTVAVHETLPPPSDRSPVPVIPGPAPAVTDCGIRSCDDPDHQVVVPSPSPVLMCAGTGAECACGEPGPHKAHELGTDPGPVYVSDAEQIAVVEDIAAEREQIRAEQEAERRAELAELQTFVSEQLDAILDSAAIAEAGKSVIIKIGTVTEQAAASAGLEPADAEHYGDPTTAAAWRAYAVAKARLDFQGRAFHTPEAAAAAVEGWQGRKMLTADDAMMITNEILTVPREPERSRPRPFVLWSWATGRGKSKEDATFGADR